MNRRNYTVTLIYVNKHEVVCKIIVNKKIGYDRAVSHGIVSQQRLL